MNYYLKTNDGGIKTYSTDRNSVQTMVIYYPELTDKTIYETEREIIELDGEFVFADEHADEKKKREDYQTDEEKKSTIKNQLDMIKADMQTAAALDNTDWQKELKAAYDKTLHDSGKTPYIYERTRCPYCGSEKLTEKYNQKWCENCDAGLLDLKLYEETHDTKEEEKKEEETKEEDKEKDNEK